MKRHAVLAAVAVLAAASAQALTIRTLTGRVINPTGGNTITAGKVVVTPYGTMPSDPTGGVLIPLSNTYPIVSGVLTCSGGCLIVSPANYKFEVYETIGYSDVIRWWFNAGVPELAGATTLQELYTLYNGGVTVSPGNLWGPGASSPICTVVGASVTPSTSTTALNKTSHGCVIIQGDIAVITASAYSENLGAWLAYNYDSNNVYVGDVLTAETSTASFTVYRGISTQTRAGRIFASTTVDKNGGDNGYYFSYYANQSTGNAGGFVIDFGNNNTGCYSCGFGDSETVHYPFEIYRNRYKGRDIFNVDAQGTTNIQGNLNAKSGLATVGNLTVTGLTTGAAPTVTPDSASSHTWSYVYVPYFLDETHGAASPVGSTTTGGADLSTDHNNIVIPAIANAVWIDIYRTVSGGTPATLGKVKRLLANYDGYTTNTNTWVDTGVAGDTTTAPTTNTTGVLTASVPYDFVDGMTVPVDATLIYAYIPRSVTCTAGNAVVGTTPTGTLVLTLYDNAVSKGTISIANPATSASLVWGSGTSYTWTAGHILSVVLSVSAGSANLAYALTCSGVGP